MAQQQDNTGSTTAATVIERALRDAHTSGVGRAELEAIVDRAVLADHERARLRQVVGELHGDTAAAGGDVVPLRSGDERVRTWFDGVGWELEHDALRSALELLGANEATIAGYIVESTSRRGLPENAPSYVVIPDWHEYLHPDVTKRGNNPVWVKSYTRWLSDDGYLQLTGNQRAILHGLHLEYARSGAELRLDTRSISSRLGLRVTTKDLDSLKTLGFVEIRQVSGKTLSSLEEKRREPPISPAGRPANDSPRERLSREHGETSTSTRLTCPVCGIDKKTQQQLDDHLELVHDRKPGT